MQLKVVYKLVNVQKQKQFVIISYNFPGILLLIFAYKNKQHKLCYCSFCYFPIHLFHINCAFHLLLKSQCAPSKKMSNRSSRINEYNHGILDHDQIYVDPSEEQSDIYNIGMYQNEGQQQQNQSSNDRNYEQKNNYASNIQLRQKSISKNSPSATQQSDINSLGYLTKQFVKLIIETGQTRCLDISQAARTLNVQKRRIYDITNVLEGIGYIQKVGKNQMRWVGGTKDQLQSELNYIQQKIVHLENHQKFIDAQIQYMNMMIQELTSASQQIPNYFKLPELKDILNKLGCSQGVIYNGREGAQISFTDETDGKRTILIQSPQNETKIGHFYIISKSEASQIQNKKQSSIITEVNLKKSNIKQIEQIIIEQKFGSSPQLQNSGEKQRKIQLQNSTNRENYNNFYSQQSQSSSEEPKYRSKTNQQPLLKSQNSQNKMVKRQFQQLSSQSPKSSIYLKKRGRKCKAGHNLSQSKIAFAIEERQHNQKQRITRSKKQIQSQIYFESDEDNIKRTRK